MTNWSIRSIAYMNLRLLSFDGDWMWKQLAMVWRCLFYVVWYQKSLSLNHPIRDVIISFLHEKSSLLFIQSASHSKAIRDDVNKFMFKSRIHRVSNKLTKFDEKSIFFWRHFKAWHHQQTHHPITNSDLIIPLSSSPFANSNDDTM